MVVDLAFDNEAHGKSLAEVLATPKPFEAVLTGWEKENLDTYRARFGRNIACNLNQSGKNFPVKALGKTLFTVIHNCGIIWHVPSERWLVPGELALTQGLEVYQQSPRTTCFAVPLERSRSAYGGQVGNSMCTAAVGSMVSTGYRSRTIFKL